MRTLRDDDIPQLDEILRGTGAFSDAEVEVALELLDVVRLDQSQQDYEVVVDEHGGRVTGYVLFGPVPLTEGTYDLYWIAVDPQAQGSGVGRRLLYHVEQVVKQRGGRLLCLETSSQGSYQRTRLFYERAGFTEESCLRDFYKPGDDRLTYVKRF